jgi:cyclic pyranopterin phosphate synthase
VTVTGDQQLTHVDAAGAARMVDVGAKDVTDRRAVATAVVRTTARIAGIMAAKRTPDLIPLCHPIAVSGVTVELEPGVDSVAIRATVRTSDRTGVEMEALTAAAVAGLTLHDMIKAVDPAAVLDAVRVESKDGGKTGSWTRPADR